LKETPEPHDLDKALVKRIILNLSERIREKLEEFDEENFLVRKNGHQRRRLIKAREQIRKRGFDANKHANISAFVKTERYFEEGKSPRMIMGRDPRFNWLYAQVIEPIEKAFFKLEQVANACDFISCGAKFEKLLGQWFCENDMSKYEASQRDIALWMEHEVYARVMPEFRDKLDVLFAVKTLKRGATQSGVRFQFEQCRGSGDLDTSLGNGVLNYIATQYFLVKNFCPDCDLDKCQKPGCCSMKFVLKGDDSYCSVPRFSNPTNYYSCFGFDAKLFIRKSPEDVEFCSGHFIEYSPGRYIYAQKLTKLIESITTCVNRDFVRNGWVAHYYKSLGLMYKQLYGEIPVYKEIAEFLCQTSEHGLNINLIDSWNLVNSFKNLKEGEIKIDTALAHVSISMTNKLSLPELEHIKMWFNSKRLSFPPHLSKRSNIKTPKVELCPLDYHMLNAELLAIRLKRPIDHFRRQLKSRVYP